MTNHRRCERYRVIGLLVTPIIRRGRIDSSAQELDPALAARTLASAGGVYDNARIACRFQQRGVLQDMYGKSLRLKRYAV